MSTRQFVSNRWCRTAASAIARIASAPPVPADVVSTEPAPPASRVESAWVRAGREMMAGLKTLVSAAVYATLIVTFGFQVARVDGLSMAPTLEDHDRLIVNKLVYELGEPRPGDIVMLYYPLNPEKMFVKRVIAKEGDTVRIVDGHVYVNDVPLHDDYVPAGIPQPRRLGPAGRAAGLLLRDGRSPEQQLRQPPLGPGAEEVHRRQGEGPLVAPAGRQNLLSSRAPDAVCTVLIAHGRSAAGRSNERGAVDGGELLAFTETRGACRRSRRSRGASPPSSRSNGCSPRRRAARR